MWRRQNASYLSLMPLNLLEMGRASGEFTPKGAAND
jgi:hypothetical protein